jgi:hypothetical protein
MAQASKLFEKKHGSQGGHSGHAGGAEGHNEAKIQGTSASLRSFILLLLPSFTVCRIISLFPDFHTLKSLRNVSPLPLILLLTNDADSWVFVTLSAMHSAAATMTHLLQSYTSTGKVSMQPGEMQSLIGAAMALFWIESSVGSFLN